MLRALLPATNKLLELAKVDGRADNWPATFDNCVQSLEEEASIDAWLIAPQQ
jgi:hypothetical protein